MARRRVRRIVPPIVFGTVFAGVVPIVATSCDSSSSTSSTSSSSGQMGVGCSFAECGVAAPCFGDQCGVPPAPTDGATDGDGEGGDGDADVADVAVG